MNDQDILKLACDHVAPHLHATARIVSHHTRPQLGLAAVPQTATSDDFDQEMAKELGENLPPEDPDSADVEFSEHGSLGSRLTVVQIRRGKVARILSRGPVG